jgi:hypothetical protein
MGYTLLDEDDKPVKGRYTLVPDDAPPAPKAKPFGQRLNDAIADAPRQLGLTARYGLEGIGGTFDALVGNPLRTLAAPLLGNKPTADTGGALADLAGLPKPKTSQERIVADATRLLAGGAVPLGAAGAVAGRTSGAAQGVARALAANPGQQLASAAAAGGAGGYTRETGGDGASQMLASLAAGVAAPASMAGARGAVGAAVRQAAKRAAPSPQQAAQIDITINSVLKDSGLTLEDLAPKVAQGLRNDVAAAFRTDNQVSPEALKRLADYRLTGLTPTAAGLTLDPAVVTQQKNLAKLGINSKDRVAQQLGQTENQNNRLLVGRLNELGAGTAEDAIGGANRIMSALQGVDDAEQAAIGGLYGRARDSAGRSAQLDPHAFTQRAGDLLNEANVESFLTPDIRNKLNSFASGKIPLNVDIAEQFKTSIGGIQRASSDGNVRKALGLVRQALDDTPLISSPGAAPALGGNQLAVPGGLGAPTQNLGQDAIDAFGQARAANRKWMQTVEQTPALQAIRNGVEPDKFVQDFVVGSGKGASVMSLAQLKNQIKGNADAMDAVREQIVSHLKSKALGGAMDEVGKFSQSGYNKALNAIGDRKLNLFFDKSEIAQLKAVGRVASYEQFQPAGSAVNNSNTAGAIGGMVDRVVNSGLLAKIPFGKQVVGDPLENIMLGVRSSRALDVPAAISIPGGGQPTPAGLLGRASLGLSPAALLGAETEEERQRRLLRAAGP